MAVLTARRFLRLVEEALRDVPAKLREALDNVAIVVEDEPTVDDLEKAGIPEGETLLGLFDGVPLTDRDVWSPPVEPARVVLFRRPIEDEAREAGGDERALRSVIRDTVIHELAHAFGFDEGDIEKRGYG